MNFLEVKNAIAHLKKTSKCTHCEAKYTDSNIHVLATTQHEGLFELKCSKCEMSTLVTVVLSREMQIKTKRPGRGKESQMMTRNPNGISEDDVLDIKNFLTKFDGNFKKLFSREQ